MGFTHSEYLFALAVVLPAVALVWFAGRRARLAARKAYGDDRLVDAVSSKTSRWREVFNFTGWVLSAAALVVAAAGPVMVNAPERVPTGTVQAVVVLDVSMSMAAEDYRSHMPADAGAVPDLNAAWGSRMKMSKYQIDRMMKALAGNQVGLVIYTRKATAMWDLTSDFTALKWVLKEWVEVGSAPGNGSNFAAGLDEALATLKRDEEPGKQKVIVLFSDGGFTGEQGELADVVAKLNAAGVKLVVIGVGMPGANPIPIYQGGQLKGYMKGEDDQPITTSFDEAAMRGLASSTGGLYHHISTDPSSHTIGVDWAGTLGGSRVELRESPVYHYFVAAALALAVALSLTSLATRRERI